MLKGEGIACLLKYFKWVSNSIKIIVFNILFCKCQENNSLKLDTIGNNDNDDQYDM